MAFFPITPIGSENRKSQKVLLYRFKNLYNQTIIVEVFEYKYNVYAIKFYNKNHRDSKHRYNLVNKPKLLKTKSTNGCENFLMVMNTVLIIALEISKKDSLASFGFMGAPKLTEMDPKKNQKNINPDCTIADTKRYKIYHLYAKRYFNPIDFNYLDSKTSSILLLRNNKNANTLTLDIAQRIIQEEIIPNL